MESTFQVDYQGEFQPKDLLFVLLNRADEGSRKISIPIKVQTNINFEERRYRLKSFIVHVGEEMTSGHYRAYSYSESRTVREFDDFGHQGIPRFEEVQDDQVQQELKNAYILFYELLPAGEEVQEENLPLETPPRAKNAQQQIPQSPILSSHLNSAMSPIPERTPEHSSKSSGRTSVSRFIERSSTPSPAKLASPKGRFLAQNNEAEKTEQEINNSVEVFDGTVTDVKYIGKAGQTKWAMDNLEFYVLVPDVSVTMFCLDNSVRPIPMSELRDLLLHNLERTSIVQPTLFYKGEPVDPDKEVQAYPDKSALILAPANSEVKHSGKLFSCACPDCAVEGSMPGWQISKSFNKFHVKKKQCKSKCSHPLYMESHFEGKKSWGNDQTYKNSSGKRNTKPFGCPSGHTGLGDPEETSVDSKRAASQRQSKRSEKSVLQSANESDHSAESVSQASDQVKRPRRKTASYERIKDIEQALLDSMSEGDSGDEAIVVSNENKVKPLPILDKDVQVKENQEKRHQRMKRMNALQYEDDHVFQLNEDDRENERKIITAPCLTKINGKWAEAQENMSENSKQAFREGRYKDVDKNDRQYISKTHVSYRNGARKIMGELTKYYSKEIHYKDFFAFGEERFLRCKNILPELENMPSGGVASHALEAYKLIIQAQLEESRREENELKFKTSVQNWETMDPPVLKDKCHKAAERMRTEANNILKEMTAAKPHGQLDRKQKIQTETRRRDKEQQVSHCCIWEK